MKHNLNINVSKKPPEGGIMQCRSVSLREKLLTRLCGRKEKIMVLIPSNSAEMVSITEISEGGAVSE